MVVMFDGKVVFEQYDNGGAREQPHSLASGAKCFVGPAAVAAVQDGLIKLDDPAVENIPEWKDDPAKSTITYRQLLSMTSGLTHPTGDDGKKNDMEEDSDADGRQTRRTLRVWRI